MKLKTLKDLKYFTMITYAAKLKDTSTLEPAFLKYEELKQETIKWVKEDFELVKNAESHKMLERWKERFNITEDDLK